MHSNQKRRATITTFEFNRLRHRFFTNSVKLVVTVLMVSLHVNAYAFDDNCEGPEGSTYVEACLLTKRIDEMDKKLNIKYQEIIKGYKKDKLTKETKLLIEAQRAWIQYRDKLCEFEDMALGGINSISFARCKARLTETRLNELNELGAN